MAAAYVTADRPWQWQSSAPSALHGPPRSSLGLERPSVEPPSIAVEARLANTLYEAADGEFVVEGNVLASSCSSQASAARRCCRFWPEPNGNSAEVAASVFRCCQQVTHAFVRYSTASALDGGLLCLLRRWGHAGALLEKLMQQRTLLGWILFEHWVLFAIWYFVGRVRSTFFGANTPEITPDESCSQTDVPRVAWHPHRDMLATLSTASAVAVHTLGDGFTGSTTHYLHIDSSSGFPLCLAWQPNNIRGALAVGMSLGVALWRRSQDEGWWRVWFLRGEPFVCPALTWSPDGRCLATAGAHGIVRIWPHSGLTSEQSMPCCVTLRRWHCGTVTNLQWTPDGTILAVAYRSNEHTIRLWDARSWRVSMYVSLGKLSRATFRSGPCLAWCNNDTLIGSAGEQLFELSGVGGGGAFGFEPASRMLPVPRIRSPEAPVCDVLQQSVLEIAVCPRTQQRIAVRVENASHVMVFERLGTEGWVRQELVLRGLISATRSTIEALVAGSEVNLAEAARPRALAFARHTMHRPRGGDPLVEGSLLAVYWDFGGRAAAEVRTYPMHYLPYKLMHSDASLVFG